MARRRWLLIVLLVGLSISTSAQAPRKGIFDSYGPSRISCATWTSQVGENRTALRWWVWGFVTGTSREMSLHSDVRLTSSDTEGLEGWIARYCVEHPLDDIVKAAMQLVDELKK
jgi:hypothetical protein